MKLYIGVNSDNTAVISSLPLMRFDKSMSNTVACSWRDTQRPPHWKIDSRGMDISKNGESFLAKYIDCDRDAIIALTGKELSWEDNVLVFGE